mmetsp:Transcript_25772/g.64732  ORF Transcript_25772/g.64732 Transcript_25772/m.64732 type:complete len:257 (-) Transcript_25772:2132-2902(-)
MMLHALGRLRNTGIVAQERHQRLLATRGVVVHTVAGGLVVLTRGVEGEQMLAAGVVAVGDAGALTSAAAAPVGLLVLGCLGRREARRIQCQRPHALHDAAQEDRRERILHLRSHVLALEEQVEHVDQVAGAQATVAARLRGVAGQVALVEEADQPRQSAALNEANTPLGFVRLLAQHLKHVEKLEHIERRIHLDPLGEGQLPTLQLVQREHRLKHLLLGRQQLQESPERVTDVRNDQQLEQLVKVLEAEHVSRPLH